MQGLRAEGAWSKRGEDLKGKSGEGPSNAAFEGGHGWWTKENRLSGNRLADLDDAGGVFRRPEKREQAKAHR